MYKVLITKPYFDKYSPTACKMLKEKGYTVNYIHLDRNYTEDELILMIGDVDAVIADSEPWTEKAMKVAPRLKVIARYGVGMNTVDTEAAKRLGIVCTNCPGINANPVAEHTLALMLAAMRNLEILSRNTKQGLWKQEIFRELAGSTVGILGFGYIGQMVAKKLTGFDCHVLAYDIAPNFEAARKLGVELTDFDTVLTQSDIICLHVPLVPETNRWINRETLAKTKRGVVFVSEARGEVIDEEDMYEALKGGQVGFFATDVFVHEPATPENTPLLTLQNVIATPHNGGETYENGERCGIMTAQQVIDTLEGREPENRRA